MWSKCACVRTTAVGRRPHARVSSCSDRHDPGCPVSTIVSSSPSSIAYQFVYASSTRCTPSATPKCSMGRRFPQRGRRNRPASRGSWRVRSSDTDPSAAERFRRVSEGTRNALRRKGSRVFRHINQLAYTVRVDRPNPLFAKMLQQAIGGIEGEMRVMNQYLFQAWSFRGPARYKDMLLNTGTEEIGHIEMLATAVALNLEGAPAKLQEAMAQDGVVAAALAGEDPRHVLSSGLGAMAVDANGNPFNGS